MPRETSLDSPPQSGSRRGILALVVSGVALTVIALFSRPTKPSETALSTASAEPQSPASNRPTRLPPARLPRTAANAASDPPPDALSALSRVAERLRSALTQTDAYRRYLKCEQRGEGDCDGAWTKAVFFTLSQHFEDRATRALAEELLAEHGVPGLENALRVQMQSSDPLVRIAALATLRASPQLETIRLPADTFRGLSDKSAVEAILTLERAGGFHDDQIASEVERLALDAQLDTRVRGAAARRLVIGRERKRLATILEDWFSPGNEELAQQPHVGTLLMVCEAECEALLERLSKDPRPEIRDVVKLVNENEGDDESDPPSVARQDLSTGGHHERYSSDHARASLGEFPSR